MEVDETAEPAFDIPFGELTRACIKDKRQFLLSHVRSGISTATINDYVGMYNALYPPASSSSTGIAAASRREVDTPINMMSEEVMEHAAKMPIVLSLLARQFAATEGNQGIRLKPRQIPLMRLMMAGLTAARLGDVNLARYKQQIKRLFHPTKITSRIFDKAGRRKGKTFVFCVFAAIAMITQPRCSGIAVAFDSTNGLVNRECVQAVLESIIADPLQKLGDCKIRTYAKSSNFYLKVEFPDGTANKCRFTPSPESTNFRGQGSAGGFFFIDEADFISKKAFGKFQGIWTMQILILMASSMGYSLSKATEMALGSVLPNGELVWYTVYSQADKVSQVVSDDYVKGQDGDTNMKYVIAGAMPTDSDRIAAVAKSVTQGHRKRPWYDPVYSSLERVRLAFLEQMQEKERLAAATAKRREAILSASAASKTLDPEVRRAELRAVSRDKLHAYIRKKNAETGIVSTRGSRSSGGDKGEEEDEHSAHDPSLVVKEVLNFEECIFLLTLPDQQSPAQMLRVKAEMTPEDYNREILNKMPEVSEMMHATFNRQQLEEIFKPENFVDDFDEPAHGYKHWVLAYDPGMNGRLSDAIFGTVLMQEPVGNHPMEVASLFDVLASKSLKQKMVLVGADKIEGTAALDMDETARRMLAHILKLCKEYPNQRELELYVSPEANVPHVAYNLGIKMASQMINLRNNPHVKIKFPQIRMLYTTESMQRPNPLPGVLTTNATKTTAIMRLSARFERGPRAFAISKRFITTTPLATTGASGDDAEPACWTPQDMLNLLFDHLTALQTIPPGLNNKSRVTTYSAKVIQKKDDGAHMVMGIEMSNAHILAQKEQTPLAVLQHDRQY